jgi:beta-galactosidase/beta-glucuronidase
LGVHIWNDDKAQTVFVETEVRNYTNKSQSIQVVNKLSNADGLQTFRLAQDVVLAPGETKVIKQSAQVENPALWSVENPYLYSLASMIKRGQVRKG